MIKPKLLCSVYIGKIVRPKGQAIVLALELELKPKPKLAHKLELEHSPALAQALAQALKVS